MDSMKYLVKSFEQCEPMLTSNLDFKFFDYLIQYGQTI